MPASLGLGRQFEGFSAQVLRNVFAFLTLGKLVGKGVDSQNMEKVAKLSMANLDLSEEATRRVADMVNAPHDPTAAKVNLARAVESLRRRKAAVRAKK